MKLQKSLLSILVALMFAVPAMAQEEAEGGEVKQKAKKKQRVRLKGEYNRILNVLELEGEQKEKFEAAALKAIAAIDEWKAGEGAEYSNVAAEITEARKAGDKEKVRELKKKFAELKKPLTKLESEKMAEVLAVLTDEQKATWKSHQLQKFVSGRYRKIQLTEEQLAQVKALCDAAVKGEEAPLPDVRLASDETRIAWSMAITSVRTKVYETVLTDEQKANVKKPRVMKKKKKAE